LRYLPVDAISRAIELLPRLCQACIGEYPRPVNVWLASRGKPRNNASAEPTSGLALGRDFVDLKWSPLLPSEGWQAVKKESVH